MPSGSWWHTGWVWLPEHLIVGLADGESLPATAYDLTTFNGKALCGTISDSLVGTLETATAISATSGSGGAHTSGEQAWVVEHSVKDLSGDCPGAGCADYSWNGVSYGAHTHSITGSYTPALNKLRLIRINHYSPPSAGMIMFGDHDSPHDLLTEFSGNGGVLAAGTQTEVVAESKSLVLGAGNLASHSHHTSNNTRKLVTPTSGASTVFSYGGGSHSDHSLDPIAVTPTMKAATVRAFRLISGANLSRLIGIWDRTGAIPPNWSLIATFDGYHLKFSDNGGGALSGNDTLSLSGTTGGSLHDHVPSVPGGSALAGFAYHRSLSHAHAISASMSFKTNRYMVKFIRYEG